MRTGDGAAGARKISSNDAVESAGVARPVSAPATGSRRARCKSGEKVTFLESFFSESVWVAAIHNSNQPEANISFITSND